MCVVNTVVQAIGEGELAVGHVNRYVFNVCLSGNSKHGCNGFSYCGSTDEQERASFHGEVGHYVQIERFSLLASNSSSFCFSICRTSCSVNQRVTCSASTAPKARNAATCARVNPRTSLMSSRS